MESTNSTGWANVPFSDSPYGYISNVNPLLYSPTNARFEENGFALFLLQAVVILVFCNVFGYAFQRLLGQPRVVGDLLAGVVIGPTALGNAPGFTSTVFPSVQRPELNLVAQIGLVVFLFLVGLETDTDLMLAHWHSVLLITVPPFALTFGVSVGIAHLFWQELTDGTQPFTTFFVFVGTVMAVTSLSVLSRILSEMGLLSTKMGAMSIAAGAGNDTLGEAHTKRARGVFWFTLTGHTGLLFAAMAPGYCLLAIASALAGGGQQIYALYQLLAFTAWLLILVFLWRPLLFRWLKAAGVNNMEANSHDHVPRLLIVAGVLGGLISSCVSDMVGLHTLVGAFFYGVAIPHGRYAVAITEAVETPVTLLLLPLYFGTVGLKIDFKTLNTGLVWGLIILLIFVIFLTKGSSTTICARLSGLSWRQAMCVGALMQSKGVIEVVIGAIALEAGVIDVQVFSALFLVFLATTSLVRPLARIIYLGHAEKGLQDGEEKGQGEGIEEEEEDNEKATHHAASELDHTMAASGDGAKQGPSHVHRFPITAAVASVNPSVESLMTLINAISSSSIASPNTPRGLSLDIIRAIPTEFNFTEVIRAVFPPAHPTAPHRNPHDALLDALRAQAQLCNVPNSSGRDAAEEGERDDGFLAVEASRVLPEVLAAHRRAQLRTACQRAEGIVLCPWEGNGAVAVGGSRGSGGGSGSGDRSGGVVPHQESTGWLRGLAASAFGSKPTAENEDEDAWSSSGALSSRLFAERSITAGVLVDAGVLGCSSSSAPLHRRASAEDDPTDIALALASQVEQRLRARNRQRGRRPRLIVPFFGGADDRAAVDFAKRAAGPQGGDVDVIVVLVDPELSTSGDAEQQEQEPPTSASAPAQPHLAPPSASARRQASSGSITAALEAVALADTSADMTVDIRAADQAEQRQRDARFLFGPIAEEGGEVAAAAPADPTFGISFAVSEEAKRSATNAAASAGVVAEVGSERLLYATLPSSTPSLGVISTSLLLASSASDLVLVGRGKHASRPASFRRDVVVESARRLAKDIGNEDGSAVAITAAARGMGRTLGAAAEGVLLTRRGMRGMGTTLIVVQAAQGKTTT